jgi:hypothetical protein
MFFAGLEIDLDLFRKALLGTAVGLLFSYQLIIAVVVGSLLVLHALIRMPIVDTARRRDSQVRQLSLIIFAVCVST